MGNNRIPGNKNIIKNNLKDSDRISVIYNNEEVEMYIADFNTFLNNNLSFSSESSNEDLSYTRILTKAEVLALHTTGIDITAEDLGVSSGEAARLGFEIIWTVTPDGTPFAIDNFQSISLKNSESEVVGGNLLESVLESETKIHINTNSVNAYTIIEQDTFTITASSAVTGGGDDATISISFNYRIIDLSTL